MTDTFSSARTSTTHSRVKKAANQELVGIDEYRWISIFGDNKIWLVIPNIVDPQKSPRTYKKAKRNFRNNISWSLWVLDYGKNFNIKKASKSLAERLSGILHEKNTDGHYMWENITIDGYGLGAKVGLMTIIELSKIDPDSLKRITFISNDGLFLPEQVLNIHCIGPSFRDYFLKAGLMKFTKKFSFQGVEAIREKIKLPSEKIELQKVILKLSGGDKRNGAVIGVFKKIFKKCRTYE